MTGSNLSGREAQSADLITPSQKRPEKGFDVMFGSAPEVCTYATPEGTGGPAGKMPSSLFDRIYVINLPERKDRLREITRELKSLGMSFSDPTVRLLSATRPREALGFPSPAVRGCFLSHFAILRQARADGLNSVLIMEDDLAISPAFVNSCKRLSHEIEASPWGFIYFGHQEETPEPRVRQLVPFSGPIITSHFYAVRGTIFDRFIDFLQAVQLRPPGDPLGGPMHYDGALSTFRAANPDILTLIAQPSLGLQRSSRSDIHGHWYDKVAGAQEAAAMARRVRQYWRSYRNNDRNRVAVVGADD
jgi:glycosyl transferase, family 25